MTMSREAEEHLQQLYSYVTTRSDLVIDADTHITDTSALPAEVLQEYLKTPDYYHGRPINAEELLAEMDMAGVDMALSWQNPAATQYGNDLDQNFENLMAANNYIYKASRTHANRIIPAGWTDPKAVGLEKALRVVEICIEEYGFPIVKMNPAQNSYPITSEEVLAIARKISGYGAVTAFHYGADTQYTPASGLEEVARKMRDASFLAVHMGGGGAGYVRAEDMYIQTREMGLRNPNIHFIMSAKRDTHIESDLIVYQQAGKPYSGNLSCASDAPYGRLSWNFGGYRAMFRSLQDSTRHPDPRIRSRAVVFGDDAVAGYLGNNFAACIGHACERMLAQARSQS